jgi:hypothetical protein
MTALRVPYFPVEPLLGEAAFMPFLPVTLILGDKKLEASGLLDSGSTVNVLPFSLGEKLGAKWENQQNELKLTGNLANFEAKAIVLQGNVGNFDTVRLAFAWTKSNEVPLIFGQTNFFMAFRVCFFRAELYFEVAPVKKG